jgi:phosphoadenosine phosphosulfate reductase
MSGLRRGQSEGRSATAVVERDHRHGGIVKVNPLAGWSAEEVQTYLRTQAVPAHPLYAQGFRSIGCAPCTRAVSADEDPRAGRWWWENGIEKECGIHATPRAVATEVRS